MQLQGRQKNMGKEIFPLQPLLAFQHWIFLVFPMIKSVHLILINYRADK